MVRNFNVETEVKQKITVNGKDIEEVLDNVTEACHNAYHYISRLNDEHNDGKPLSHNYVEWIEGEICNILNELGD